MRVHNCGYESAIVDSVSAAGVNNCGCVSGIVDFVSVVGIGKCFLHGTHVQCKIFLKQCETLII